MMFLFIFCFFTIFSSEGLCNGMRSTGNDMDNEKTIIIREHDNGKEIKVKCGGVVQIELEEMGSAGYLWNVDKLNTNYLELLSDETVAVTESKIGAPLLRKWRFKAYKKGYTEIKIDHYRKWEGIEKAAQQFLIKLSID